jgi:hypothetical protein
VQRFGFPLLLLLTVGVLALTVLLAGRYLDKREQLQQAAFESARNQSHEASLQIDAAFSSVMSVAQALASDLTSGVLAYGDIEQRLRDEVAARPDMDGLAITFAPFVYDPSLRLYQMYIYKEPDNRFSILDGATYDYTRPQGDDPDAPNTDWYLQPLANGAMWNPPFFASGAQKVLIEYGIPFYQGSVAAGVVTADYSLQDTRDLIASLDLGSTGYGMLLSSSGVFLAHPVAELVARSTIHELADSLDNETLREIARRAENSETFAVEDADPITGEISWLFVEPIRSTGWSLVTVLHQNEFAPDARVTLQDQVAILLAGVSFALAATATLLRVDRGAARSLWKMAIFFSILCVLLIAIIWYLTTTMNRSVGVTISDQTTLDRYLERYRNTLDENLQPMAIPTGILIQSVQFPSPVTVTINGYIWQHYDRTIPEEVIRGFSLPQRTGEQLLLEEVLRREQDNGQVIVWNFGATLTQSYDTVQFPFDRRDVTIRIAPADLTHELILIPDLEADTALQTGLDSELVVNNWRIGGSAYSYKPISSNTSFGLANRALKGSVPELHFTLSLERESLGPFIAYLLPSVVVALMIFAYMLSDDTPESDRQEVIGTLSFMAALFFVTVVTHTALRESIAAVNLTYLEYVYLLLYFALVGVSLNVFLVARVPGLAGLYRNNLIPRLLYWPLFSGTVLAVTLAIFVYP